MGLLDQVMAKKRKPGRGFLDAIADNVVGYDDGVDTPGERLGRSANDLAISMYQDPMGLLEAVLGDLNNLMFEGGAMQRPEDVLGYAAAPMAPGAAGLMKNTPTVTNALSWGDRIEQSTPAAWADPKYDKPQWHPASKTSMSIPAGEIDPIWADTVRLSDEVPMSIDELQGRLITPAYGDRTRAGGELRGYNDIQFNDPVRMLGGRDFMREPETGLWASEKGPMSAKGKAVTKQIEAGESPALVYTAMNSQSGDFSTLMMDAVMNQYNPKAITEDAAKVFDDRMAKLGVNGWPGARASKEKVNEALKSMPGSSRWQVWQEMDKAAYKAGGFPDIGQTRVAITDPELLDVTPFSSGLSVGRPTADVSNDRFAPHPSYSHQIDGDYEGTLGNLPGQLVWRDFFEARRGSGAAPASDQRAFMMSSPSIMQRVDQQMVDEINQYLSVQDRLK